MPLSAVERPLGVGVGVAEREASALTALDDPTGVATADAVPKASAIGEASIGTGVVASGNEVVMAGVGICVAVFVRVTALMSGA